MQSITVSLGFLKDRHHRSSVEAALPPLNSLLPEICVLVCLLTSVDVLLPLTSSPSPLLITALLFASEIMLSLLECSPVGFP